MQFPPIGKAAVGYVHGWSGFLCSPGSPPMHCRTCGTECFVRRKVLAAISWGNFVAGRKELHDFFYCPHIAEGWHIRLTGNLSGERPGIAPPGLKSSNFTSARKGRQSLSASEASLPSERMLQQSRNRTGVWEPRPKIYCLELRPVNHHLSSWQKASEAMLHGASEMLVAEGARIYLKGGGAAFFSFPKLSDVDAFLVAERCAGVIADVLQSDGVSVGLRVSTYVSEDQKEALKKAIQSSDMEALWRILPERVKLLNTVDYIKTAPTRGAVRLRRQLATGALNVAGKRHAL